MLEWTSPQGSQSKRGATDTRSRAQRLAPHRPVARAPSPVSRSLYKGVRHLNQGEMAKWRGDRGDNQNGRGTSP